MKHHNIMRCIVKNRSGTNKGRRCAREAVKGQCKCETHLHRFIDVDASGGEASSDEDSVKDKPTKADRDFIAPEDDGVKLVGGSRKRSSGGSYRPEPGENKQAVKRRKSKRDMKKKASKAAKEKKISRKQIEDSDDESFDSYGIGSDISSGSD